MQGPPGLSVVGEKGEPGAPGLTSSYPPLGERVTVPGRQGNFVLLLSFDYNHLRDYMVTTLESCIEAFLARGEDIRISIH